MNRLVRESSPYLRQHAGNPVDWYPWGEEALERARREGKPIFLSVGYSSCHWCHVMAHESFEDEETAAFLNEHFVSIKVDREERPDVDALYMRAVMLMTGSGGWPLTVFLTPSLSPFYGGTYFPPVERHGIPAFRRVLEVVAKAYSEQRPEIEDSSQKVLLAMSRSFEPGIPAELPGRKAAEAARRAILPRFDDEQGGFGRGPKFPQPVLLDFLLNEDWRHPGLALREKVFFTLRQMEAGGVRDQVGGGFHRYSVDGEWRVPHFEKMLYDNALLASLYFRAHVLSGDGGFEGTGREILRDLQGTLAAPGGGFFAALDADSEGEEGKFYLWSPEEVRRVLEPAEADLVCSLCGLQKSQRLDGRILHRRRSWTEAAAGAGQDEGAFRERVLRDLSMLREARESRVHPSVDTNVLTDWNALAAQAFLDGYLATGDGLLLATGLSTLEITWRRCWQGKLLMHVWDGKVAKIGGFLSDYAYLARAEYRGYEATGNGSHLDRAGILLKATLKRFKNPSGQFFDTPSPEGALSLRVRGAEDGVLPSPLSVLGGLLWDWERITASAEARKALDALLRTESERLRGEPGARPLLADLAACRRLPDVEVVVAAPGPSPEADALLAAARRAGIPRLLVLPLYAGLKSQREGHAIFEGRHSLSGVVAYVCAGRSCKAPIADPEELKKALEDVAAEIRRRLED